MYGFSREIEDWFADYIGKCFEMSTKDHYDSVGFAREFLNSTWGSELLLEDRIKEYESLPYMYAKAKKNLNLKKGETYDPYVMWMYGYLVKYWIYKNKTQPDIVWNTLPIDRFENMFGFYHTQGWNYIICDAEKRYAGIK